MLFAKFLMLLVFLLKFSNFNVGSPTTASRVAVRLVYVCTQYMCWRDTLPFMVILYQILPFKLIVINHFGVKMSRLYRRRLVKTCLNRFVNSCMFSVVHAICRLLSDVIGYSCHR